MKKCIVTAIAILALLTGASAFAQNEPASASPSLALPQMVSQTRAIWLQVPTGDMSTAPTKAVQSITITAAATGSMVVTVTGTFMYTHVQGNQGFYCLQLSQTKGYLGGCLPASGSDSATRGYVVAAEPTNLQGYGTSVPYTIVRVWPVTAGQTYTFYLNGATTGFTAGGQYLFHPSITAVISPTSL